MPVSCYDCNNIYYLKIEIVDCTFFNVTKCTIFDITSIIIIPSKQIHYYYILLCELYYTQNNMVYLFFP